jgi:hypothetical protein
MTRRSFERILAPLVVGLVVLAGCNPEGETTPEHKLHDTKAFSSEELNAPLSSQAKAKGIQVAPAPTR